MRARTGLHRPRSREERRGLGFTALGVSLLLSGVGAGVSAYSSIKGSRAQAKAEEQQGAAQREAAESQAGLADYNAKVAELQAKDARIRGAEEEGQFRQQVRGMIGSQRAGFAGSNIDVGSGSALDVQADAAFLGELDALTIRNNAAREAWGFDVEAEDQRRRAEIARKEGVNLETAARESAKATRRAGVTSAIGIGLNAGANLLQSRYQFGPRRKVA
jgi:hypothetical protein